jgi:hypothetical protein
MYFNVPAGWSMVADTNTYIDRAEFLENALDTVTDYTKTESTTRNVQIMSPMAACQVRGNNSTWVNGFYRQASWNLVDDRVIEGYVYIPAGPTGSVAANIIVGASDGSGQSFADFHCGIDFAGSGGALRLVIFENADGTSRGVVGPSPGYSLNKLYRWRITLHTGGSATYQMQGGTEYPAIGSGSWTDITPGTASFGTTNFHLAAAASGNYANMLVADMKVYDPA